MKINWRKNRTEETAPAAPPILQAGDVEKAILGCLISNPDHIPHAAENIKPEAFYGPVTRQIFEEIISFGLKCESFDLVTFTQHMADRQLLDKVGGAASLSGLLIDIPTNAHYHHYAVILDRKLRARQAWEQAEKIKGSLMAGGDDFEELSTTVLGYASDIRCIMEGAAENEDRWGERVDEVASNWTERYQGRMISAISSPWPSWDRTLGGVRKGYNLILGAKKTGKSSLMGHLALHLAVDKGMRTKIFTYETPVDDYIMRLASNLSGVRGDCIFSPDIDPPSKHEINKISNAFARIASAPLSIVKGNGLGVREIARESKKFGAFFVVIDYLLLLPRLPEVNQKEGTEGAVRANSCALIELSREIDGVVCVINHTASSGDRKGESRWGDQPENDADMTLLVESKGITVKSRRNGEAGAVMPIHFHGETYSFKE